MYLEVSTKKDYVILKTDGTSDLIKIGRMAAGIERRNIGAKLEISEDRPTSASLAVHITDLIKILAND